MVIENSLLTSSCENTWQGIEVWGDSQAHQWPDAQGNYAQGYLELNDAIIENAIVAVSLWKPGDYSKTGGIVVAGNSVFRNNRTSVHALYYRNYHPVSEKEMDYRASFTRCTFEINENYPGAETFYKHVDLSRVKGVKFLACNFSLSPNVPNVSAWNMGIGSYSAGFSVNAICSDNYIPCQNYDHSTFTGLNWAINANNTDLSTRTFYVNRAKFNSNAYGIRVSGINNFTVLNSDFHIGYNTPELEPCDTEGKNASGFGIHMTGCTGFAIEESYFTKAPGAPLGYYTGILIAETQAVDQVYRNTFNGLSYGNYAVGKNWFLGQTWKGLAYYCNENAGNTQDIKVVMNSDFPPRGGVQNPIGSISLPSGNIFSSNADYHINNLGEYWFGYYYYAPSPGYTNTPYYPANVYRVTREEVVGIQNQCPSNYGGGGSSSERDVVMTPAQKQQAEMEYTAGLSDYNNVKTLFDNLKDGGSTTATLNDITTAWPSDMWALRAELLGKSPHLSMDVLKAAADRTDVLPESVIFEIMAANPDELKKEELIKYLEDKDNPLPEYMIDILRQVAMGSSYKTVLLRQMAHYGQLKNRAAHNIIRSLLNDTISDNDELRNWLDNIGGKRADEQIIASYLSEGNFTNAFALANMMPALYNYSGNELAEHSYYMDMLNLQINLEQQQRTIFGLDSLEVANLVNIAENSQGTAGIQAKGILEYAYGYHFCNCIEADESSLKSGKPFNPASLEKLSGIEITVVPNPAKAWAAFNYTLPGNATGGVIVISDASGREVASMPVSGKQGQQIWDTRAVQSGVYFYTLNAGGFSKHGKIVISK
ncbi:MAG: T9SS type A sorting domain-containing protein [Bacteroidales bacterium]|nr:T9SS type A sorting domain-containing protein [Bacteroidales bacterium]